MSPKTARILPWVVAIAFFMQTLDMTILNTALPAIAESLRVNPIQMQSTLISYMLTVALLIPASGWLSDRFGTRRIFILAIFLFSLGSLACAISSSLEMMVLSRALQGTGGALLLPVGRLAILKAYPRDQLVHILSFITIPGLLGPLVGPTLGGFLVQYASWEWIFLINLPVGVLGAVCAWFFMPNIERHLELERFDLTGFVLFGTFMVSITIGFESMAEKRFSAMELFAMFAAGMLALTFYCWHAWRAPNAIYRMELFKTRNFSIGVFGNLVSRLGLGATPFMTPLLLQMGLGYSPSSAGMSMIPITLGAMSVKQVLPPLIKRLGYRTVLSINTVVLGVFLGLFAFIDRQTSFPLMMGFFFIYGIANSTQFTAMNTIILVDLPDRDAGSGNSLLSVIMQLSMSMGVAVAAGILGGFSDIQSVTNPDTILDAFHKTYLCLAAMVLISVPIFFAIRPLKVDQQTKPSVDLH